MKNRSLHLIGQKIEPGKKACIGLPSADLYTQTKLDIPIHVFHGKMAGPTVFVSAAIHGDELNGITIIRRLHAKKALKNLRGTLITIPVVNIHGFILQSRYLPDRRDLNRSFPGSSTGSMASRLASQLIDEIISHCQYGIDLHTGAYGRINMPQLRVNFESRKVKSLARAFNAPIVLNSKDRDGSLRQAAGELGIPLLVYEGGEALRHNEHSIQMGVRGILRVLHHLNMITLPSKKDAKECKPLFIKSSRWVRANASGIIQPVKEVARSVKKGEVLAIIHDPFLTKPASAVVAPFNGIIIGRANLPLVNEGDAMYHVASFKDLGESMASLDEFYNAVQS